MLGGHSRAATPLGPGSARSRRGRVRVAVAACLLSEPDYQCSGVIGLTDIALLAPRLQIIFLAPSASSLCECCQRVPTPRASRRGAAFPFTIPDNSARSSVLSRTRYRFLSFTSMPASVCSSGQAVPPCSRAIPTTPGNGTPKLSADVRHTCCSLAQRYYIWATMQASPGGNEGERNPPHQQRRDTRHSSPRKPIHRRPCQPRRVAPSTGTKAPSG